MTTGDQFVRVDAEYDEELRFAGAGVLRIDDLAGEGHPPLAKLPEDDGDHEYVYPPKGWETPAAPPAVRKWQGAPYRVEAVNPWPSEVDEKIAAIDKRLDDADADRAKIGDAQADLAAQVREMKVRLDAQSMMITALTSKVNKGRETLEEQK